MSNFAKLTAYALTERNKALATHITASSLTTACATNGADTAKYGVYFEMTERDDKYLLYIENAHASAEKTVTIKAGNDKIFGSGNDLTISLAAGKSTFLKLDSGRFKNVTNNDTLKTLANVTTVKDCVVIEGESTDIKVALVQMPA